MKKLLLAGVLLLLGAAPSWAQNVPLGSGSTELTGTISTSGTYQQVFAASSNGQRKSCMVENTSASNQLVFFGPTAPSPSTRVVLKSSKGSSGKQLINAGVCHQWPIQCKFLKVGFCEGLV